MIMQKYTIFISAAMLCSQTLFSMLPMGAIRPGQTSLPFHCDKNRMQRELQTLQDTASTSSERGRFFMMKIEVMNAHDHDKFKSLRELYTNPAFLPDGI